MRKLIIGLLLGLMLACSPAIKLQIQDAAMIRAAFKDACQYTRYECERGVPYPVMVVRDLDFWGTGVRGLYAGGPQVYLDDDLTRTSALFYVVLVHEITHYLQRFAPNSDLFQSGCSREGEAFEAAGKTARAMGKPYLDRRATWWFSYSGCSGREWPEQPRYTGDEANPVESMDSPIID